MEFCLSVHLAHERGVDLVVDWTPPAIGLPTGRSRLELTTEPGASCVYRQMLCVLLRFLFVASSVFRGLTHLS